MVKSSCALVLALAFVGAAVAGDDKKPMPKGADAVQAPKHKPAYAREYYHVFKGDPTVPEEFLFHGLEPRQCALFEPAGLRISLPPGHPGKRPGTGITINTPVQGDFEITMSYEIIEEPKAPNNNATGLFIWIDLDLPKLNRGFILSGARQGKQYVCWYHLTPETGNPVDSLRPFPAKDVRGKLRMVRTGSVLYYYVAEGAGDDFTLLTQHEFGAADLQAVRWGGTTGGANASLEGRFFDVRIRADGLPDLASARPPSALPIETGAAPPAPERANWLALGIGLAAALLFALLGAAGILVSKARRPSRAAAGGEVKTEASPVLFRCSGCGRKLNVQPELAGKKVKCARCGAVVLIPTGTAGDSK